MTCSSSRRAGGSSRIDSRLAPRQRERVDAGETVPKNAQDAGAVSPPRAESRQLSVGSGAVFASPTGFER